ncbi:MAG: Gfo/Idh/MocA family oxidoreductase [Verrucomicrobia bacterium]|nr:Gfo/Idh/MocA family oxidoreductase [Verrucomicrobiota bacterium]MCH8512197.1 Gfo/Idh/MocA family oxidoreductase [Kiritimatiellia bacterium]
MSNEKRYAVVGTGGRSDMFINYLAKTGRENGCQLVGFCDLNPGRMAHYNRRLQEEYAHPKVAEAAPEDFERMLKEQKVDAVIVTTIDRSHDEYICRAMEAGCDVITEKPMTTDERKCQRILDTRERTGRKLTVTFNYRYAPRNSKIKELLMGGAIGRVTSVHFEWLLDTIHGADYFRRWHRDKRNSGGLMVHKATHHFDLVNWWLGSSPETVMAMGDLVFYGRANAEARGVRKFYTRGTGDADAVGDPFALDLTKNKKHKALYLDNESYDSYRRDQSVFSDGISIEDDMGVLVRYRNQAVMTYHLTAYSPWEGFRVMFNGTKGRLESEVQENTYVSGADDDHNVMGSTFEGGTAHEIKEPVSLLLRPHWSGVQKIEVPETNTGGHGGGDIRLLNDVFGKPAEDPLGRAAGHVDGAMSILTGIAANRSMASGMPVNIADLVKFY